MSETIRTAKTTETSPGITQEQPINDEMESPLRRRMLKLGVIVSAAAAGTALTLGVVKYNNSAEAEPSPEPTSTSSMEASDPEAENTAEPSEAPTFTEEVLTLDTFPFIVDGQEYRGVDEFAAAFSVPSTPVDQYPGSFASGERDEAIQADVDAGLQGMLNLANQLINYDFTYDQEVEFMNYDYTDSEGNRYIGTDAVRAQFIGEAFRSAMVGDAEVDGNSPDPEEFINQLTRLSVYVDWEKQRVTQNGETPYTFELAFVEGTEDVGGTELATGEVIGLGTVQVEIVTNQGEGNTASFDITGGERGIGVVDSGDIVTWQVVMVNTFDENGNPTWKLASADSIDENGNSVL
jgi:hypothetical protein